ncbi:hypothetical protein T484DRAFT_1825161 [Baffinella frigidus]|nr:hypothetical protein T484DRAFT_1825161 [Cryptophyta sp. CCMP2293]
MAAALGVLHVLLSARGSEPAAACCGHNHAAAPPPQAEIAQEHKVLDVRASETTSLRLRLPVTLRGYPSEECPTPTLRGMADSESTVMIEGKQGDKFGVETLKLSHPGTPANETIPAANETIPSDANTSLLVAMASGTCCIGVDGGKVRVMSCSVSAFNGTCVGATGNLTSVLVANCTLSDATFGVIVAAGT